MFQLIVAIISIGLVSCLMIASIFFGGAAFTEAQKRANAQSNGPGLHQVNRTWSTGGDIF